MKVILSFLSKLFFLMNNKTIVNQIYSVIYRFKVKWDLNSFISPFSL
jgi:hypothetical protein